MADKDALQCAEDFLAVLHDGEPATFVQLARALDELMLSAHDIPRTVASERDAEPPDHDYAALYAVLGKRYPEFGYYTVADPTTAEPSLSMVGDGIDDLADITSDLREVLWRRDNVSSDDAYWHMAFLYRVHWGRHAREFSVYLHTLAYEQP